MQSVGDAVHFGAPQENGCNRCSGNANSCLSHTRSETATRQPSYITKQHQRNGLDHKPSAWRLLAPTAASSCPDDVKQPQNASSAIHGRDASPASASHGVMPSCYGSTPDGSTRRHPQLQEPPQLAQLAPHPLRPQEWPERGLSRAPCPQASHRHSAPRNSNRPSRSDTSARKPSAQRRTARLYGDSCNGCTATPSRMWWRSRLRGVACSAGGAKMLMTMALLSAFMHMNAAEQSASVTDSSTTTTATTTCEPFIPLAESRMQSQGCQRYEKVCIDQQQFISYDPRYNPKISAERIPAFDVDDIVYNWPNPWGNGDKFARGHNIHVPRVVIRASTSEEACPDLQNPVFSRCTVPIVLWQRWLYNVGEVFETSYGRVYEELAAGRLDPRATPVVATPHGLRLPPFVRLFYQSVFRKEATSLADFSARRDDPRQPSNATAEGWHIRCFEAVYLCKIMNRKEANLWSAGQHLLRYYESQLPSVRDLFDVDGADRDTLKVVLANRPNATGRAILNDAELLSACNALDPLAELPNRLYDGRYRRTKCVAHEFGRDMLYDLALSKTMDVLVTTHGAVGYHSFYMARGASLVEVLPYGFSPSWVNMYYSTMLQYDKKVYYWAIWITDANNSRPSAFQDTPTFRRDILHREHNVLLPWPPLKQQLLRILRVGGDAMSYKAVYVKGRNSITDKLEVLRVGPNLGQDGWHRYEGVDHGDGGVRADDTEIAQQSEHEEDGRADAIDSAK